MGFQGPSGRKEIRQWLIQCLLLALLHPCYRLGWFDG